MGGGKRLVVNARVNGNRSVHGNRKVLGTAKWFARATGGQSTSVFEELGERECTDTREGEWMERKGSVMNARANGHRSVHGNRRGNSSGKRHDNGCRSPKRAPKDQNRGYAMRCFDRGWQW